MSGANNPRNFAWTPEAIGCLREWRATGLSSGQISTELAKKFRVPVSRSAVIGKLSRMGIEMSAACKKVTIGQNNLARKPRAVTAKARVSKDQIAERRVVDLIRTEKEKRTAPPPAVDPDTIATAPCCIMGLTHASCRWPLNRTDDNGEVLFCNNGKVEGRSYCEGHSRRAYTKTQSAEQRRAAQIERDRHRDEALSAGRQSHLFGFGMQKRFA